MIASSYFEATRPRRAGDPGVTGHTAKARLGCDTSCRRSPPACGRVVGLVEVSGTAGGCASLNFAFNLESVAADFSGDSDAVCEECLM